MHGAKAAVTIGACSALTMNATAEEASMAMAMFVFQVTARCAVLRITLLLCRSVHSQYAQLQCRTKMCQQRRQFLYLHVPRKFISTCKRLLLAACVFFVVSFPRLYALSADPCHSNAHNCSNTEECLPAFDNSANYTCACAYPHIRLNGSCTLPTG